MTWPPTRPVRKRWFGVVFLLVWVAGMYLCWGWPVQGEWVYIDDPVLPPPRYDGNGQMLDISVAIDEFRVDRFGFVGWLATTRSHSGLPWDWAGDPAVEDMWIEPRGLTVALIMTAVSSLILYVGWRAAVGGFVGPRGVCDGCGYDLRALDAARCPECGEERH